MRNGAVFTQEEVTEMQQSVDNELNTVRQLLHNALMVDNNKRFISEALNKVSNLQYDLKKDIKIEASDLNN